jgi:hypothetical protein
MRAITNVLRVGRPFQSSSPFTVKGDGQVLATADPVSQDRVAVTLCAT